MKMLTIINKLFFLSLFAVTASTFSMHSPARLQNELAQLRQQAENAQCMKKYYILLGAASLAGVMYATDRAYPDYPILGLIVGWVSLSTGSIMYSETCREQSFIRSRISHKIRIFEINNELRTYYNDSGS